VPKTRAETSACFQTDVDNYDYFSDDDGTTFHSLPDSTVFLLLMVASRLLILDSKRTPSAGD
jgi:hypothetical protein